MIMKKAVTISEQDKSESMSEWDRDSHICYLETEEKLVLNLQKVKCILFYF
jgi:hypothetical protein